MISADNYSGIKGGTYVTMQGPMMFASVIFGLALGYALSISLNANDYEALYYIQFPGILLHNMLFLTSMPLAVSAVVTGTTSLGNGATGKILFSAVAYYVTASLLMTGVTATITVLFGAWESHKDGPNNDTTLPHRANLEPWINIISQSFPTNLVRASFETVFTEFDDKKCQSPINSSLPECVAEHTLTTEIINDQTNYLAIIIASFVLGGIINVLEDEGLTLKGIFHSLNKVLLLIIKSIIWYAPIGIVCMVTHEFISHDSMMHLNVLHSHIAHTCESLALLSFNVLPLMYLIITRKNPLTLAAHMTKALVTALVTSSSFAALPMTIHCLVNDAGIDNSLANLLVPVGAVLSNDGTTIYHTATSIYMALNNNLGEGAVFIMSFTLALINIGTSALPSFEHNSLLMILDGVGLTDDSGGQILLVDWFLRHFASMMNVWSNCVCIGIFDHYFSDYLKENLDEFDFNDRRDYFDSIEGSIATASERSGSELTVNEDDVSEISRDREDNRSEISEGLEEFRSPSEAPDWDEVSESMYASEASSRLGVISEERNMERLKEKRDRYKNNEDLFSVRNEWTNERNLSDVSRISDNEPPSPT